MMNLLSQALRRNPYPVYSKLRRFSPLIRLPGTDASLLFDYASVKRALTDSADFSSAAAPPGGKPLDWLIFMDPPRHAKRRAMLMKAFTRDSITALEPHIRQFARNLLAENVSRGRMDFAGNFASPLPTMVIAEIFGIPLKDLPRFMRWNEAIANLSRGIAGGEAAARAGADHREAKADMSQYVERFLSERGEGGDNLLSRLASAEVEGERLTTEEIVGFFELLLSAATETTSSLIANTLLCLSQNPTVRERLSREPTLLPAVIEEVIRFRSPLQMAFRQTRRDVELHGKTIRAGSLVLAMIGSANHDPSVFPQPDRFDIDRVANPHLGFGYGIHFCIGSALARLETRVAMEEVLRVLRDVELENPHRWEPRDAIHVHGPKHLWIRFSQCA